MQHLGTVLGRVGNSGMSETVTWSSESLKWSEVWQGLSYEVQKTWGRLEELVLFPANI
jgi:hypothetical protein